MSSSGQSGQNDSGTGTLGKAISLLDMVVMSPAPMRFTDILQQSGQPRGTLHRQLTHLVEEGLLEQKPDQTYIAGIRLLKFASQAWANNDLRSIAAPHLRVLHEATQESVHLGILRKSEIIYLDKIDGKHAVRMYSQIGRVSPVYCTGIGKAALSLLPPDDLERIVGELAFHSYTENTITSVAQLMEEIEKIRERGFAFDLEEHEIGIQCIAVPVLIPGHAFKAAISITGPAYRLTCERLEGWAEIILDVAQTIAREAFVRLPPSTN